MNATKFMTMLRLQNELNSRVDPKWLSAQYNWQRAIMAESIELMEHVGWKWWKKQEFNKDQVDLELVDIWHFFMSLVIEHCDGNIQQAGFMFHQAWEVPLPPMPASQNIDADLAESIARTIHDDPLDAVLCFRMALNRFGMTDEHLYHTYIAKNVLNLFRQDHGYQEGTYQKVWNGKEDNEVLASIMASHPEFGPSELRSALELEYKTPV